MAPVPPPRGCGPNGAPLEPISSPGDRVCVSDIPGYSPLVRDFDELGQVVVEASSGFVTIVQWECPQTSQAKVQLWGHDAEVPQSFLSMRWRVTVNGEVRLIYPTGFQVSTLLPSDLTPLHFWMGGGQTVRVEASNEHASDDYCVAARIKGIYFPEIYQRA